MSTQTQSRVEAGSSWRGALLVSGTCIGGGMLAMPIQTGAAGFFISLIVVLISWAFMTFTGLLLVEATFWLKNNTHFSSMTEALLGKTGKVISLVIYLFINCASLVAYTSGGAHLIDHWAQMLTGSSLGYANSCLFFTLLFGTIVYFGAYFITKMNSLFMIFMAIVYLLLVGMGIFSIQMKNLLFRPEWVAGLHSFPLIIAAFSYQMIVPSLCSITHYNLEESKKSILIGTAIPCLIYLIWLSVVHGIVPFEGSGGLHEAYVKGSLITESLQRYSKTFFLVILTDLFAFLALVTSYLGLSLALFDFVKDLFKNGKYKANWVTFLSLVPSLLLAIFFPRALLDFLDMTGGFGDALLSGLIPIAMVWVGRFHKKQPSEYRVFGGKWSLVTAGLFAIFIFMIQWIKLQKNLFNSPL